MTVRTQAQLNNEIQTSLPDNVVGQITPSILRSFQQDVCDTLFSNSNVNPQVSVMNFGAKGNGITDDYPAINAAITALSVTGGVLYFPPGVYSMSQALVPVTGVSIQGAGANATFIKVQNSVALSPFNSGLVIFGTLTGDFTTATTYGISSPTEGGNTVTTSTHGNAGNFSAGSIIAISGGLHSTNFWYPFWTTTVVSANSSTGVITLAENLPLGGSALSLVQKVLVRPNNIKVSDLTVYGTTNGAILIAVTENIILDNVAVLVGSGGISASSFSSVGSRNVIVRNCNFPVTFDLLGSFDSQYLNNTLNKGCMVLDGGCQNCLFLGNTITDPAFNGSAISGISVGSMSQRNRIIGNSITNVPANNSGITIVGVTTEGRNIISGNNISTVDTSTTYGISIGQSKGNIIIGNSINTANNGIAIATSSLDNLASSNLMTNVTTPYSADTTSSFYDPIDPVTWTLLTLGSTTPSVANSHRFEVFQSGAQNITSFTGGRDGQEIILYFGDSNTTLKVSGTLHLAGSVDYNPPAGAIVKMVSIGGANFYELSRSANN